MHNEKEFASKEALAYWEALIYTLAVNMQLDIYCIRFLEQILKDKVLHQRKNQN
jgi:hypothetical protein